MKTKELSSAHQKQHFNGDSDAPGHGQNQEIALRLTGDLWIYPAGHYKPVVITGTYHELDDAPSGIKLFPAGLNLDIGELRRLDGHLTRMRYDSFDVMETDLPLIIRGERRTALVALFVGHLLGDTEPLIPDQSVTINDAHAYGTALFRTVSLQGSLCEEPFRFRLLELDRFQLIQGEMAWQGTFFQCVAEEVTSAAGQALLRHIQNTATAVDPLNLIRRAAHRYLRMG